jgi:hypothetical protein
VSCPLAVPTISAPPILFVNYREGVTTSLTTAPAPLALSRRVTNAWPRVPQDKSATAVATASSPPVRPTLSVPPIRSARRPVLVTTRLTTALVWRALLFRVVHASPLVRPAKNATAAATVWHPGAVSTTSVSRVRCADSAAIATTRRMIVCKHHSHSFALIIEPYERNGFGHTLVTADNKLVFQLLSIVSLKGPNDSSTSADVVSTKPTTQAPSRPDMTMASRACPTAMSTKSRRCWA